MAWHARWGAQRLSTGAAHHKGHVLWFKVKTFHAEPSFGSIASRSVTPAITSLAQKVFGKPEGFRL
eukprot:358969-Chlamydomonas_euryale.AAC.5